MKNEISPNWMLGKGADLRTGDLGDGIEFKDHKIRFVLEHCQDKDILDIGCVQHNPENYRSRFWLHKAIASVARSLEGMDLYEEGVEFLRGQGYEIHLGNAEDFMLGKKYDVIVAGDIIEHLENLRGFLKCCAQHLRPGGVLLISTPNPWYWKNILKSALRGTVKNNPEHTLWLCPVTLRQLLARHDMRIVEWHYGSRYLSDRLVPLPKGIKHTSFHAVVDCIA